MEANSGARDVAGPSNSVDATGGADGEEGKEYRWEAGYEKTWEAIQEDKDGMLDISVQDIIQKARRKRLEERQGKNKLGMMRHLYIILDMSESMKSQDLKPTRLMCTEKLLEKFVEEYFYLNPISQIGIIVSFNKRAEKVSDMTGNPRRHIDVLKSLPDKPCSGEPSLQNSLDLVIQSLKNMPSHTSREVIVIMGSLTTCDPGDINKTISQAAQLKIKVSVINLSAEVRICRELARRTGGNHTVILDDHHLLDLLNEHLNPPPSLAAQQASLIRMGFPSHAGRLLEGDSGGGGAGLGMCMCHMETGGEKISSSGYNCPQCKARYCELPVECRGCGLTLVSAPHLARSYHHLFPLQIFQEVEPENVPASQLGCNGCGRLFKQNVDKKVYKCPQCQQMYCAECDLFIHETLHSCPACSCKPVAHHSNHVNGAAIINGVS